MNITRDSNQWKCEWFLTFLGTWWWVIHKTQPNFGFLISQQCSENQKKSYIKSLTKAAEQNPRIQHSTCACRKWLYSPKLIKQLFGCIPVLWIGSKIQTLINQEIHFHWLIKVKLAINGMRILVMKIADKHGEWHPTDVSGHDGLNVKRLKKCYIVEDGET